MTRLQHSVARHFVQCFARSFSGHTLRAAFLTGSLTMAGCGDISADLPAGSVDPAFYTTPEAVAQMARGARYEFQVALLDFMIETGRISDETFDLDSATRVPEVYTDNAHPGRVVLDQRHLPDETLQRTPLSTEISRIKSYKALQRVRTMASLAHRAVAAYEDTPQLALRGELMAYEALAEIMLADLYCSGIPLSTIDFGGDYTYQPGSTTAQVYEHAVTLLDSAAGLATADPAIFSMVRVAKGRALLALGQFEQAATAVRDVPAGFQFRLPVLRGGVNSSNPDGFHWSIELSTGAPIASLKGGNGLPFATTTDPRIRRLRIGTSVRFVSADSTHLVVGNHLEARLIEAEAALRANDPSWLTILNTLRTTTGGVAGLPVLTDPGLAPLPAGKTAFDVRVDLLFRERAFWLFFTGHRQGDLRRLLRHYGRTVETVYPMGPLRGGFQTYDEYVDVPIPNEERFNPYFSGCTSRGA